MLCPALDCGTQNWDRILHALPNPFGFKSLTVSICISVGGLWQALELLTCCCLSSWCSSQSLPTGIGWGLALATCGYQTLLSHHAPFQVALLQCLPAWHWLLLACIGDHWTNHVTHWQHESWEKSNFEGAASCCHAVASGVQVRPAMPGCIESNCDACDLI